MEKTLKPMGDSLKTELKDLVLEWHDLQKRGMALQMDQGKFVEKSNKWARDNDLVGEEKQSLHWAELSLKLLEKAQA